MFLLKNLVREMLFNILTLQRFSLALVPVGVLGVIATMN